MALTEAQKRYQSSEKGKAARARYMAKRKARLAEGKVQATEAKAEVETPASENTEDAVNG